MSATAKETASLDRSQTDVQVHSRDIEVSVSSSDAESASAKLSLNIHYHKPLAVKNTSVATAEPTILFLPFWGGTAGTYESVLHSLAARRPSSIGIALSYRGTGVSSRTFSTRDDRHTEIDMDSPHQHSVSALAADVLALLCNEDFIKDFVPPRKLIVCAHSMSAKVTWELLHRLSLLPVSPSTIEVESVLLLAPAPIGPLELPSEIRQQQITAYESVESARWTVENVLTHKKLGGVVVERAARDCAGMSPGAKRGWIEVGMGVDCAVAVQEVAEWLRGDEDRGTSVRLKVCVLVGTEDVVETVERVKSETQGVLEGLGFNDVGLNVLEGCGHLIPLEDPDSIVEAILNLLV